MNVLLLNPPYFKNYSRSQRSPAVTKSGTLYFPIWLSYAAGVLDETEHSVSLIDAPALQYTVSDIHDIIDNNSFELVVIDTSTPSIDNDVDVARSIKEYAPRTKICLVGTHVSVYGRDIIEKYNHIDFVAVGEYDRTLVELCDALSRANTFWKVPGVWCRWKNKIRFTGERELLGNLDTLPFVSAVYKKFLNYRDYFNPNARYPQLMILAGRGCPNKCSFCVYPQVMYGHKYRKRSIENIVAELEYIQKEFPGAAVFFEDDTLTADTVRLRSLCKKIIEHGIRLSWSCNSRAELDLKTMKYMKKAGCYTLCTGFESGVQSMLNSWNKNITLDQMRAFAENARKAKLRVHGCFMFGAPGETIKTMQQTLDFAESLPLTTAQFYPVMVYPGTEIYKWAEQNGFITARSFDQWLTEEGLHNCVVSRPDLTAQTLVEFCDYARRRFYLRPKYILQTLKMMCTSAEDAKKILKAFFVFFKYLLR